MIESTKMYQSHKGRKQQQQKTGLTAKLNHG